MTKREELEGCITALRTIIDNAQKEIVELKRETYLLSDEKQWFKEEVEEHGTKKKPKQYLIGRIRWIGKIEDEDTHTFLSVNRSRVVRVDGEWK